MKVDEIKLRLSNYASGLIDKMMPPTNNLLDKLKNSGAKYWLKQNIWRLDQILGAFSDANNEIDVYDLSNHFLSTIFDESGKLTIDTSQIISSDLIPQKIVILSRQDLFSMFGITEEEFKARCGGF
jgi:hypothetical protein